MTFKDNKGYSRVLMNDPPSHPAEALSDTHQRLPMETLPSSTKALSNVVLQALEMLQNIRLSNVNGNLTI